MRKTKILLGIICLLSLWIAPGYAGAVGFDSAQPDKKATIEHVASVYTSQIGVRELTGNNDGYDVEKYLAVTGFGKGYSWCAAFVSWSYKEANVLALKNAWAPSWFPPARTIYSKGSPGNQTPHKADVFGIYYEAKKRIGHVGFIDAWPKDNDYVITVEGNTNSAGSREGDGVYKKRRLKSNIYKVSRWV